jgi:putative ABC transport system substrate-binding protein
MASHIGRRKFLAALGGTAVAWPLAARAQQAGKTRTIGILNAGSVRVLSAVVLPDALRELGWIEGQNVIIERRYAENRVERLPELAAESLWESGLSRR